MIARLWRGQVPAAKAAAYRAYQAEVGPPGYLAVPGNRGVFMLGRDLGARYEVAFLTLWESLEAIRAFAGDPIEKARYYEHDFSFLVDPPEEVEHFEVVAAAPGGEGRARVLRFWRGASSAKRAEEARRWEERLALPSYARAQGSRGAYVLGRLRGERYEVATVSLWASWRAVRGFAGDPVEGARYDAYDRQRLDYLVERPATVEHFEVLARGRSRRGRERSGW